MERPAAPLENVGTPTAVACFDGLLEQFPAADAAVA
jgi:hypothetical protein